MYTDYWQMNRKPFESGTDPEMYYPSETHQGSLLKLRYAIENRRGGALLAGGPGTGKTLLIESMKRTMADTAYRLIHVVYPKMSDRQLLSYLACTLSGNKCLDTPDAPTSLCVIEDTLRKTSDDHGHCVLVIDEAHLLDEADGLECVRLLLNFQDSGSPLLTVVLAGQAALLPTFDRLATFEGRFGVKCLLRPMNLEETASYVNHRLRVAGVERPIFDDGALEALFQITGGVPRLINRLCDLALLIGYAEQLPAISAQQIEAVNDELVFVSAD